MKDQIEILTEELSAVTKPEIKSSPWTNQIQNQRNALLDTVATEEDDEESTTKEGHRFAALQTTLLWVVYAGVALVVLLATGWVGHDLLRYLNSH